MTAQQLGEQRPQRQHQRGWARSAWWRYSLRHYWELPANICEAVALVLVVFVQDIAFRESVVVTAALLILSFCLHGLANRAKQCQVWPKVIEVAAPLLFIGLAPAAWLPATSAITQRTAFITINFWFVLVQLGSMLAGHNFIRDYYHDLYPVSVWGTPLLERCSLVVGLTWVVCQTVMGLAAVFVFVFGLSVEKDVVTGVLMCYVMQLLPLLWAVAFTFAYPAVLKRRWGYVAGVRETCCPPPRQSLGGGGRAAGCADTGAPSAADGSGIGAGPVHTDTSSSSSSSVQAGKGLKQEEGCVMVIGDRSTMMDSASSAAGSNMCTSWGDSTAAAGRGGGSRGQAPESAHIA